MDFSIERLLKLLHIVVSKQFRSETFKDFITNPIVEKKTIVLRHDVDLIPENSLRFAKIQTNFGIKGTYYFRAVPESWNEKIMINIYEMGHEVGYHYETMDTAYQVLNKGKKVSNIKSNAVHYLDLLDLAYEQFVINLEKMRTIVPVSTICMHGSPQSPFDNKAIWAKYNYKELGLFGEPYLDVDFNEVFYLTDTGRCWDGWKVSVRDKVEQQSQWVRNGLVFRSTQDIIAAIEQDRFPSIAMLTFHPQRWHDKPLPWIRELVLQSGKNIVKRALIYKNK